MEIKFKAVKVCHKRVYDLKGTVTSLSLFLFIQFIPVRARLEIFVTARVCLTRGAESGEATPRSAHESFDARRGN